MFLIDTVYRLICIFLPVIIAQYIMIKKYRWEIDKRHLIWSYIYIIYIFMAISLAGTGSIWDIGKYGDEIIRMDEIMLIPFNSDGATTYILNIIMFIPLGFLLPYIWKSFRNLKYIIFSSFIFSLSIELTQLLNRRTTDIDDLIMNTIGGILGFIIFKIFSIIFKINSSKAIAKYEPIIYFFVALLGRFLLFNWHLWIKIIH